MENVVLEVKNLVKNYGSFRAVDSISFTVPKGKVVGLLGPNGAGKTTTIQTLLGITLANGGTISYFGKDFFTNREWCLSRINFTSSFNNLQGRISVWENLLVFSLLYNVKNPKKRILELVSYFEIEDLLHKRFVTLSSGQKTRINLIKSLLNDPALILMDEPTAALDPDISDKTLSLIERMRTLRELSIVYTSHDMAEVARICDEVIFLDRGRIVAQDTPLGLTKRIGTARLQITFDGSKNPVAAYLKEKDQHFSFLNEYTVLINTEEKLIPKLIFGMGKAGIWITDIEVKKPTLEDVFLQIARKKPYVV